MGNERSSRAALAIMFCTVAALAACGGGGSGGEVAPAPQPLATAPTPAATPAAPAASPAPVAGVPAPAPTPSPSPLPSPAPTPSPSPAPVASGPVPTLGACEMFPATAVFNTRIDDTTRFPARSESAGWIASIGTGVKMHADWGVTEDFTRPDYYGAPINVVDGTAATTQWPVVSFDFAASGASTEVGWPGESDCAVSNGNGYTLQRGCSAVQASQRRFPFPNDNLLRMEAQTCTDPNNCGDHHVLVVEQGACRLWESYFSYKLSGQWYTLSSAAWDLKSLALRPAGWTSADAASLPITPFLLRVAEASSGDIRHALRVTLRDSALSRSMEWPARHSAGNAAGSVPWGAVMRLKADFLIPDSWTTQSKAIATAMKRYGVYIADIGSDFYITGEPNATWDNRNFGQLGTISLSNMEFVNMGAITGDPRFSANSMAGNWN